MKINHIVVIVVLLVVFLSIAVVMRFAVRPTTPKAEGSDKNPIMNETNPSDSGNKTDDSNNTKKIDFTQMVEEQNALLYMEKEQNMYCAQIPFGVEGMYFYSWVLCGSYEADPTNGGYRMASGSSIPTRFEYDQNNLSIIGYKQPLDGSLYNSSMKELFPEKYYKMTSLLKEQVGNLESQSKDRFLQSLNK